MPSITVDQLDALDRAVQMTQDQRLAYHLTVTGAAVPETGIPLYPGVPVGSEFASPVANPDMAAVMAELCWPAAEVGR